MSTDVIAHIGLSPSDTVECHIKCLPVKNLPLPEVWPFYQK